MVRKLKKKGFSKFSFVKKALVDLGDGLEFPVRTLSLSEEASISLDLPRTIPTKITVPTQLQKDEFKAIDKNYNPDTYIATKVYDTTSDKYLIFKKKEQKYKPLLESLKYIDFERKMEDEDGNMVELYKQLGLSSPTNWLEICELFEERGFHEGHATKIIVEINKLKGDTIFERIDRLQSITDMDYIDLITALEKVVDERNSSPLESSISQLKEIMDEIDETTKNKDEKLSIEKNKVDTEVQEEKGVEE